LRIKGITLVRPQINVKVLADGRANYDIAIPSADTVVKSDEPSEFSLGIDHWEIQGGILVYDDASIPYFLSLKGLNHTGSGDFTQDVIDLRTHTKADTVTTAMGRMEFLTNKSAEIDAEISISEDYTRFTFKENRAKINDFAVRFEGWFKMNPDNFGMDITYGSPENSFKSLLSLVPGMYTRDFKNIETSGSLAFSGLVKGTYSETQLPAFEVNLGVKDAMFKYPDLPIAIRNITLDLLVSNTDGIVENTQVNLKNLHLDFGSNPVDARLIIENLRNYSMDGAVNAKLNLAELSKMFPMEGLEMRGIFSVNAKAKGVYDSVKRIIPSLDASLALASGFIKSSKFPIPMEDMAMNASVKNASGKLADTFIAVDNFSMTLDGEKLAASLKLQNLDDYTWDLKANGGIDLGKMTKVFPLEGMTIAGKVKANIDTRGKMSDITAKRYDRLPTSGSARLSDFSYTAAGTPALSLKEAAASFDPKKIELSKMEGTIGRSDFNVDGRIESYLGYVLGKETIKGVVTFRSNLLDLNEFMTDSGTPSTADSASFGVIPIPEDIDFVLHSNVATAKMMDYTLSNASGDIVLRNGIANLSGLRFGMLGGSFQVNGTYSAKDVKHPKYDFDLKIEKLSIQQAANSFSMIKSYVPIAGLVNGDFSTDFKISGELTQQMTPNLATMNGAGLLKVAQAALNKSSFVSGLSSLTKLNNTDQVTLKDVLMSASITNGRFSVKPFEVKMGDYATTVSGSTGLDMSLDYSLRMMVPAGQLGSQFQGLVNQYTGSNNPTDKIPVTIGIGGTVKSPTPKLVTTEQKEQAKQAAETALKQKTQEATKQLLEGSKPADLLKGLTSAPKTDTTKKDSTKKDPANQLLQLKDLLKKKKKN
jgi:AsmA-like C-terminal region